MTKVKNFLKNYKTMLLLILAMIVGAICGLIFKEDAMVVKPLGDLFLNLMFVIIVPLVFLTISIAVAKVKHPKRLGKIMISTVVVFLITSGGDCKRLISSRFDFLMFETLLAASSIIGPTASSSF